MATPSISGPGAFARSGCSEGGGTGDHIGEARRTYVSAVRTFRHMGVGCVTGMVACGVLSVYVMPRPVVPSMVTLGVVAGALCGIVSGFAVRALRNALWEGHALRRMSAHGFLTEVKQLCDDGVWIDVPDGRGRTALMYAVDEGNEAIVEELLNRGARVDHVDLDGATSLVSACKKDHTEIAKMLVKRGADCNRALVHAVRTGDVGTVEALIVRGGNPDHVDGDGWPLLAIALKHDRPQVVEKLIEKFKHPFRGKRSFLSGALERVLLRDKNVAKELIAYGADVDMVLRCAVCDGRVDVVKGVIDQYGADVNRKDYEGSTPLFIAVKPECGCLEVVEALLDRGADFRCVDMRDRTPLARAAESGHLSIVKVLIARGADVDSIDSEGNTPLILAVKSGCLATVRELATHSTALNHVNGCGDTALIEAAGRCVNNAGIMRVLLGCNVRVDCLDKRGRTLLIRAINAVERCAVPTDIVSDVIRWLLRSGVDVHHRDHENKTVLFTAACHGDPKIVEELLEYGAGAEINVCSSKGETPLIQACAYGHTEVVKELLKCCPVPDACDHIGRTAINMAAQRSDGLAIVRELLEYGADLDLADNEGVTPLMEACSGGHADIVEELLEHGARLDLPDWEGNTVFERPIASSVRSEISAMLEQARKKREMRSVPCLR
ncbi:MAG: ankyrin repeat domain-containing protein [Simkaniaceae bacterium]|nr:ankyrin repeat domain-containing protein [Simkaniaceae bacterium]